MGKRRRGFQIIIETFWSYITSDRPFRGGDSQWCSRGDARSVSPRSTQFCAATGAKREKKRGGGFGAFMCSEQLCRSKSIQIEVCSSFTPTNRDLISKMLARLVYTKKPAGRGCNRWREVGWKANLGDAYVLRVPLGLPWVGRIWQKRSVQQKNPPLCLSMGY